MINRFESNRTSIEKIKLPSTLLITIFYQFIMQFHSHIRKKGKKKKPRKGEEKDN